MTEPARSDLSIPYPGLLVVPTPVEDLDRSLGWSAVSWMESLLCHGPGDVQGDPIELDDELRRHLVMAYSLNPEGRRTVIEDTFSRLKGRAKSEFAGMVTLFEWVGPCRFDHWAKRGETSWFGHKYEKGEPVGRPVRSSFIRCLATEEEQAGNTYDNVIVMATEGRLAGEMPGLDIGETRSFYSGNGRCEIRPSSASNAAKDGGKETFSVCDEIHLYNRPDLRSMFRTVRRNGTKRREAEPWILCTTTMHDPAEESVGKAKALEAENIAAGLAPNRGTLFDHRSGPPVASFDWDDDKALAAAIRVAAGDGVSFMDIDRKLIDCRSPESERSESERYHLNLVSTSEGRWMDHKLWASRLMAERPAPKDKIAIGFDGSRFRDSTWLVGCRLTDRLKFPIAHWDRPVRAGADWEVPVLEVTAELRAAFANFKVVKVFADPPYWETTLAEWQLEWSADIVEPFFTNRAANMFAELDRFMTDLRAGEGGHTGDKDLTACVLRAEREHVGVRTEVDGRRPYRLVKPRGRDQESAESKIDGAVACVLADAAACKAIAEGALTKGRSILDMLH